MTHYLIRFHTYYCDSAAVSCRNSFEEYGYARNAWREAWNAGWRAADGKHYCPEHANEAKGSEQ